MARRSKVTEEDLIAKYGPELWNEAVRVKNTDRDNPSVHWNTESLAIIYLSFSKSPKLGTAVRASGAPGHLINNWRRANPSFDDFVNSAKEEGVGMIEDALFKQAERGNVNAAIAVLKAYKPELYAPRVPTGSTALGPAGQVYDLSLLSPEEVRQLEQLSNKALVSQRETVPNESNPLVQKALENRQRDQS